MTTLIPILAQCSHCHAWLTGGDLARDPEVGYVCADAGMCAARVRAAGLAREEASAA